MLRLIIRTGCTSRWLAFLIAISLKGWLWSRLRALLVYHAAGLCWEKVISPAPPKPPVHKTAFFRCSWRIRQIILQQLLHNFLLLESCGVRGHSSAVMDGSQAYGVHMLIVLCLWSSLSKCQGLRAAAGKMLKSFSSVYCTSGKRFTAVTKTWGRRGGGGGQSPCLSSQGVSAGAVLSAAVCAACSVARWQRELAVLLEPSR